MSQLCTPPPLRHRASSTNIRPVVLSINLNDSDPPEHHSMLFLFIRSLFPSQKNDLVLPLSDSTHEKFTIDSPHPRPPSIHAPILLVLTLFPLSTALVLFCVSTLPTSVSWPRNLADLAQLGRELHSYSQSGSLPMAHVVGVMSITAVWKHAWSIPGSIIWNVLAGVLFSPVLATLLLTTLTTIGSACATLLSTPLAPFLTHFFPRALDMTRSALGHADSASEKTSPTWVRLAVLRLIGVVPWSGINIACGVCGVSIIDCLLGAFIGSLPWTAVTCQIGDILQTVASAPSPTPQSLSSLLVSPWIILKLALLSFLSLAPILARERLRSLIIHPPNFSSPSTTKHVSISRWTWAHDWYSLKLRSLPFQARCETKKDLDTLVQEKSADSLS